MRDFTLKIGSRLLREFLEKGYRITRVSDFQSSSAEKTVILRHDVDARPLSALAFARMEKEMNIRSTFYFKTTPGSFDEKVVGEIAGMGHEIGYHYEDLSSCKGSFEKAIGEFARNLEILRRSYPVTTICMDGHVLSRWNNLDLWKKYNYRDFGITIEPYLDFDFSRILYLTDTGRRWNAIHFSLYDKVDSGFSYYNKSTEDILDDLKHDKLPSKLMISLHPQRWHDEKGLWLQEATAQFLKNIIKYIIIKARRQ